MTKPRPIATFVHRHQSGKFNATAAQWDTAVQATCAGAGVATFTETTEHQPSAPKGYRLIYTEHAPDTAAYVDESTISVDGHEGVEVAKTRYMLGGKRLKPTLKTLLARLRLKNTDQRVGFLVIHEPSAVEPEIAAHGQASRFPRVKALYESFVGIHRAKHEAHVTHGIKVFVLTGDFNLDLHKLWVRALFHTLFPSLALSFKTLPPRGDLGDRLISVSFYSRRWLTTTGSVLDEQRHEGFDHLGFTTHYRFKRKAHR